MKFCYLVFYHAIIISVLCYPSSYFVLVGWLFWKSFFSFIFLVIIWLLGLYVVTPWFGHLLYVPVKMLKSLSAYNLAFELIWSCYLYKFHGVENISQVLLWLAWSFSRIEWNSSFVCKLLGALIHFVEDLNLNMKPKIFVMTRI